MRQVRTTARIAIVLLGALVLASGACDLPQAANGNGQPGGQTTTLTVTVIGLGVVDVVGHGTAWSAIATPFEVSPNAVISLEARPAGYFVMWTGNVADTESVETTIVMTGDQAITAVFPTGVNIGWSGWSGQDTLSVESSTTMVRMWTCSALNDASPLKWELTFESHVHVSLPGGSMSGTIEGSHMFDFGARPANDDPWRSDPEDFTVEGELDVYVHGTPYSGAAKYYYSDWVYELSLQEDGDTVTALTAESVEGYYKFCITFGGPEESCSDPQHVSTAGGGTWPLVPELHPGCPQPQ